MTRRSDAGIGRWPGIAGHLPPLFALLLSLGAALAQPSSSPRPDSNLEQGRALIEKGRFEEALSPLARFKESRPADARGWYYTGLALAGARRWREAAADFSHAVEIDPEKLEYRILAASALAQIDQLESAVATLRPYDGERLPEQRDAALLWLLGDLHYRRQRYEEALRALRRYASIQPRDARCDVRVGRIHLLENRFQEAAAAFQTALEKNPADPSAHNGLGLALARQGQAEEALASLRRATELDPDNAAFLLDWGRLLLETGAVDDAVAALERAKRGQSPAPAVYYELSKAYRRAGQTREANQALDIFQRLDRSRQSDQVRRRRVEGLLKTGQDRLREGRVGEARQAFSEVIDQDPGNWLAHSFLAKIYLSSSLLDRAASHLFAMEKIEPESVEGNYLLATYWYRTRNLPKALESAQKALLLRPDYGDLRNLLGNIYFSMGKRAEALQEYAAAVKLEPEREEFQKNYAAAKGQ